MNLSREFFIQTNIYVCRFHPACIDRTIADIQKLKHFLCPDCFDHAAKRSMNLFAGAPYGAVVSATKAKVRSHLALLHVLQWIMRCISAMMYTSNTKKTTFN